MEGKARIHDVLSHVCNAVLELNESFVIDAESPNFGAIALHGGSCYGRSFVDFIVGEDRPHILQFFMSNSEGTVNSCTAQLVIPPSSAVRVTVWHSCSSGLNGGKRHLIGVQEDEQEFSRPQLQPLRDEPWQSRRRKKTRRQRNTGPQAAQEDHQAEDLMRSSSQGILSFKPDTAAVMIRSDRHDPQIVDLTVGAKLLFGPSVGIGSPLARVMPKLDTFVAWMQDAVNRHLHGRRQQSRANRCTVALLTHTSHSPMPFTCRIIINDSDFDDETETMPAWLVFDPQTECNSSCNSSSGSSSSSSGEELTGRKGKRRCGVSSDNEQPSSGALAHESSATRQPVERL